MILSALNNATHHMMATRRTAPVLGSVVVAVDGERQASPHALKWAVDRLLCRDTASSNLILLHVRHSAPLISFNYQTSNPMMSNFREREPDDREMVMLRPFRGFCVRRQIKFEIVVVEDDDVAQALVDYTIRHRVQNLLLGASSRKGFSRLFKHGSGIASTVLKWIPNFCSVYVISKLGKLNCARNAALLHPLMPSLPPPHQTQPQHILAESPDRLTYNEVISEREVDSSFPSPETRSPSNDGTVFLSFYEEFESIGQHQRGTLDVVDLRILHEYASISHKCTGASLFLTQKLESMEEGMKRLKSEQKQTMDMYHVACKEALTSKQN